MAVPGLPALAENIVINAVALVTQDVLTGFGLSNTPQWGLFLANEAAIVSDNVVSFEFKQDARISNFPVEDGAFETYNKVQVPYDVRLQFSTGGALSDRQAMLASIDAAIASTDLYDAVTPEKIYSSVNVVHQSIRRTSRNGVGLLVVDVYCEQVRVTATQQFASTQSATGAPSDSTTTVISIIPGSQINQPQSASAAPQISDGTVQPTAPTTSETSAFNNAMPLP
jgi:hypothetical protein